jgi:hypothetical protein
MLQVSLSPPVLASNAVLVITSSYDRGATNNPRNVQVVELTFLERALPGTFGHWSLGYFTDAQLSDSEIGGSLADPDHDGIPNLGEFSVGEDPFVPDPAPALLQRSRISQNTLRFTFRERDALGDVQRFFETSTNLLTWLPVTPAQVTTVATLPNAYLREATFPVQHVASYYRLRFNLPTTVR